MLLEVFRSYFLSLMACSKSRVDLKRKNNRFWKALCLKVRLIVRGLAVLQAMIEAFTSVFRLVNGTKT